MQIIGLSGFARSGKDETAKVLVEQYGFTQVAFADKLREFLHAMNPAVGWERGFNDVHGGAIREDNGALWSPIYVQDVIGMHGWGGYKETPHGPEIRRLLQRLGTEAGRQTLWDTIWIDAALTGLPDDAKVVVSDARFFNEFDAVRARGGEIWRIERPDVGPANEHPSEMEAITYEFDRTLYNSGDLNFLQDMVGKVYVDFANLDEAKVESRRLPGPNAPVDGVYAIEPTVKSVNMPKRKGRM